jgi:hypothetical protein
MDSGPSIRLSRSVRLLSAIGGLSGRGRFVVPCAGCGLFRVSRGGRAPAGCRAGPHRLAAALALAVVEPVESVGEEARS